MGLLRVAADCKRGRRYSSPQSEANQMGDFIHEVVTRYKRMLKYFVQEGLLKKAYIKPSGLENSAQRG